MTAPVDESAADAPSVDLAIVVRAEEDACTVFWRERSVVVPYAAPFPRPRAGRVAPGHLVAIASLRDGRDVVIWRWFDAVVVEVAHGQVLLSEPLHGPSVSSAHHAEVELDEVKRFFTENGLWHNL